MKSTMKRMKERTTPCPACGSKGFLESVLGGDRCSFCDGTEAGLDPFTSEVPAEGYRFPCCRRSGTGDNNV
jgi:hypothetical protein